MEIQNPNLTMAGDPLDIRPHVKSMNCFIIGPASILVIYFIGMAFLFHPGIYHNDSLDSLHQAEIGAYRDWHPPIMAATLRIPIAVFGWRSFLFYLQIVLFLFGVFLFCYASYREGKNITSILLLLLPLNPITIFYLVIVQTDTLYACSMLVATGLLAVWPDRKMGKSVLFLGIFLALTYAIGVRWNGIAGSIPIMLASCFLFTEKYRRRWFATVVIALVLSLFSVVFNSLLSYRVLHAERSHPEQVVFDQDFAGMSVLLGRNMFPEVLRDKPYFSIEAVEKLFTFRMIDEVFWPHTEGVQAPIQFTTSPEELSQIKSAWVCMVLSNPYTYIHVRMLIFDELLQADGWRLYNFFSEQNGTRMLSTSGIGGKTVLKALQLIEHSIFMMTWLWILVLIGGTLMSIRYMAEFKFSFAIAVAAISGIFYFLAYFFIVPSAEQRYAYWSIIAANLSVLGSVGSLIDRNRTSWTRPQVPHTPHPEF